MWPVAEEKLEKQNVMAMGKIWSNHVVNTSFSRFLSSMFAFFSSSFISEYAAEISTILWLFPTEACQGNVVTKPFLGGGHYRRCLSSHVNVQKHGSIAILELNRRPVNSFSLEFLEEINTTLGSLENDQDCQGVIITSVGYHVVHVFYFKWSSV